MKPNLAHLHSKDEPTMTIEEAKLQIREEIAASDLLTKNAILALKDNITSDKFAVLENLIAEL